MKIKKYSLLVCFSSLILFSSLLFAQQKDTLSYQQAADNYRQKKYELTLQQALQLKEQYTLQQNEIMYYKTIRLIGHCHKKTGNYENAITCYLKAFKGFKKLRDTAFVAITGNNLSKVYFIQKSIDSAVFFTRQSLWYNRRLKDSLSIISSYLNLSVLYERQKKYDLAIKYSDSTLFALKSNKNFKKLINAYNNRANIYYKQKKYQKAKETYLKGYALFDENTKNRNKNAIIQNLAAVYMLLGEKKKAKDFVRQALSLNDSINKQKYNAKITEIEAKYNVAKEIQTTQIERQKKEQLQLWFLAVTLILLGLTSIIWFYYRANKVKKDRLALRLANQELEQYQKIKKLQNQNQNKVLNAIAVGKETERIAIAQVLHDSVGALLSSANMHLQVVKKKSNQEIIEIEKTQNIIDEASSKVRNLSHQLISEVLLKFGLVVAIENLCTKYSNAVLIFELVAENEIPRFQQAFEIKMHSIIEELLNNSIKHSKATEVLVSLYYDYEMLTVSVEDNGIGLNLEKIHQFESVGLAQIKARVESNNGVFIITSTPNKFSKFHIKIPVACEL